MPRRLKASLDAGHVSAKTADARESIRDVHESKQSFDPCTSVPDADIEIPSSKDHDHTR